jgi:hypothetical protein
MVEGRAALVEIALGRHSARHPPQAHLAALGPLAAESLGQRDSLGVRLGQALSALTLAVRQALPLPSSRKLGNEASLLELRDGPQNLADEDGSRGVSSRKNFGADAAMRLIPFALSMSCPASWTIR